MTSQQMDREAILRAQLKALVAEHRALDTQITELLDEGPQVTFSHQIAIRQLKKQKLGLKDRITRLEDEITPDIIA